MLGGAIHMAPIRLTRSLIFGDCATALMTAAKFSRPEPAAATALYSPKATGRALRQTGRGAVAAIKDGLDLLGVEDQDKQERPLCCEGR